MRRITIQTVLVCVFLAIQGCASKPSPYATLSLEWQIDGMSDWMLHPDRSWNGDSPFLNGEFGLEWKDDYKCFLKTGTSLFTGAPFHSKKKGDVQAELYWTNVGCSYTWGGK